MKHALPLLLLLLILAVPARGQQAPGNSPTLAVMFEPKRQATLSAEASGRVESVTREMGQPFAKGDVLVRLDAHVYQQTLKKARAALHAAAAHMKTTARLHQDKAASETDLRYAERDLATAQAGEALAAKDVASCSIEAPFAGRVKRTLVKAHEWVDRGKPVVEIVDDSVLLAKILLPSWSIGRVPVGMVLQIAVNETGETVAGKVAYVGEVIDAASSTYEIQVEVDNSVRALRSGMTGALKNLKEKI